MYDVIWPFQPESVFTERLMWLTDVIKTRSGEQRIRLRSRPRRQLQLDYMLNSFEFGMAKSIAEVLSVSKIALPLWHQFSIANSVGQGATSISVQTTNAQYSDYVFVWSSNNHYGVFEISSMSANQIDLADEVDSTYNNAVVCPVAIVRNLDGASFRRQPGYLAVTASAQFTEVSPVNVPAETWPEYLGFPVIMNDQIYSGNMTDSVNRAVETIDSDLGLIDTASTSQYTDRLQSIGYLASGYNQLWDLYRTLYGIQGRLTAFWLPSFNRDFQLEIGSTPSDTTLLVKNVKNPNLLPGRHISINRQIFRRIAGVVPFDNGATLVLDDPIGSAISVNSEISFMNRFRLDADSIELSHTPWRSAEVSVAARSLPDVV